MVMGMGIGIQQTWFNLSAECSTPPFLIYKNEYTQCLPYRVAAESHREHLNQL